MQPENRTTAEAPLQKRQNSPANARKILSLVAMGLAVILVAALCISMASASRAKNEYANSRNAIGFSLYRNLRMLIRSYDGVLLAGADIEGSILPEMKKYFHSAKTLDEAIIDAYGERYSLLAGGTGAAFESAFQAFDDAFRLGKPTSDAISAMSACVQSLDSLLLARYNASDELQPA